MGAPKINPGTDYVVISRAVLQQLILDDDETIKDDSHYAMRKVVRAEIEIALGDSA